jgi:phage shock protein C
MAEPHDPSGFGTNRFGGRYRPWQLYKKPSRRWVCGVCAGLADYFDMDVRLVRGGAIVAALVFNWFFVVAYFVLAAYLPSKPDEEPAIPESERGVWRHIRTQPSQAVLDLRQRAEALERKLAALEADVTSPEFALREQFRRMR